jgi:glycosyltransferase involved in cell wall biosynthesis
VPRAKLEPLCYAFEEEPYRGPRRPSERVRFGFFGQLAPHKGVACLLAAVERLVARAPRAEFELVLWAEPSPGRHARYAARCRARVDGRRVRFGAPFGPDEAPLVLAGLDALVVPSEWDENAPLSVLQARAAGVPVIASDVPGIAEIVRAPEEARLVPVGDADALAGALAAVLAGELRAPLARGLPLALDAHLARLEQLYAAARGAAGVKA